jgi:acylphosphatase
MMKRVRITVRGAVQGVGFRASAHREARALGLRGYVRNRPNGDVEIVAEGEREPVERLITWARRGPPAATVESVDVRDVESAETFADFRIRP